MGARVAGKATAQPIIATLPSRFCSQVAPFLHVASPWELFLFSAIFLVDFSAKMSDTGDQSGEEVSVLKASKRRRPETWEKKKCEEGEEKPR